MSIQHVYVRHLYQFHVRALRALRIAYNLKGISAFPNPVTPHGEALRRQERHPVRCSTKYAENLLFVWRMPIKSIRQFCWTQMAFVLSINSSNFLRFICAREPFQITKSALGSSAIIRRSLFSPILKYAAASSIVSVYFSQTGISIITMSSLMSVWTAKRTKNHNNTRQLLFKSGMGESIV